MVRLDDIMEGSNDHLMTGGYEDEGNRPDAEWITARFHELRNPRDMGSKDTEIWDQIHQELNPTYDYEDIEAVINQILEQDWERREGVNEAMSKKNKKVDNNGEEDVAKVWTPAGEYDREGSDKPANNLMSVNPVNEATDEHSVNAPKNHKKGTPLETDAGENKANKNKPRQKKSSPLKGALQVSEKIEAVEKKLKEAKMKKHLREFKERVANQDPEMVKLRIAKKIQIVESKKARIITENEVKMAQGHLEDIVGADGFDWASVDYDYATNEITATLTHELSDDDRSKLASKFQEAAVTGDKEISIKPKASMETVSITEGAKVQPLFLGHKYEEVGGKAKTDKIWGAMNVHGRIFSFWGRRGKQLQFQEIPGVDAISKAEKKFKQKQSKGYVAVNNDKIFGHAKDELLRSLSGGDIKSAKWAADLQEGAPPSRRVDPDPTSPWYDEIINHPNFHINDYSYLVDKGHDDQSILELWNRPRELKRGPQTWGMPELEPGEVRDDYDIAHMQGNYYQPMEEAKKVEFANLVEMAHAAKTKNRLHMASDYLTEANNIAVEAGYQGWREAINAIKESQKKRSLTESQTKVTQLTADDVADNDFGKASVGKWQVYVKSPTAKSGWIAQGQPHADKGAAEDDAKSFVTEGTWSSPQTVDKANELATLFQSPFSYRQGSDLLYDIVGDDELLDSIGDSEGYHGGEIADMDARGTVARWIYNNWVRHIDPATGNTANNSWVQPWDPQALEIVKNTIMPYVNDELK